MRGLSMRHEARGGDGCGGWWGAGQALRSFALNGSDYPSHAHQDAAIRAYLRWHNRNARPAKAWRLNAEVHHSLPDVAA